MDECNIFDEFYGTAGDEKETINARVMVVALMAPSSLMVSHFPDSIGDDLLACLPSFFLGGLKGVLTLIRSLACGF